MWFSSSTSSQARRYDIPISLPAAEMEPCFSMSCIRAILPGPRKPNGPKSMRMVRTACGALAPAAARRVVLLGAFLMRAASASDGMIGYLIAQAGKRARAPLAERTASIVDTSQHKACAQSHLSAIS
jgi:hypothetical protein